MSKPQSLCMKGKTMQGSGAVAIFLVTGNWNPEISGMNTDLVFPAGIKYFLIFFGK